MKKFFLLLLFVPVLLASCRKDESDEVRIYKTFRIKSPGSLGTTLSKIQKNTVTALRLYGKLNAADFQTMRDEMPNLAYLDLTNTAIVGNAIPDYAFRDPATHRGKTTLKSIQLPREITAIGNSAFSFCTGLTGTLTIPNSVTSIGNCSFSGCSGFTGSLTIPNSVTSIERGAFEGCTGFTGSLTIGSNVTEIGGFAFYFCSGFTGSLVIPDKVINIGNYAFYNCEGFTGSLTISNSVTSIEYNAFYDCTGFADIKVSWATPIAYMSLMLPSDKTVYVPSASLPLYQAAYGWKSHKLVGY